MSKMDVKNVLEIAQFATEKMQKINLFESKNFFCDVYCLEPGQEQKVHAHQVEDKLYFVLSGRGSFMVGDETQDHGEQEIVFAPAGRPHGVKNTSNERLKLLVLMTPNPSFTDPMPRLYPGTDARQDESGVSWQGNRS